MASAPDPLPLLEPSTMRWRWGRYPRIDAVTMRDRLALFGVDVPEHEVDARVSRYLRSRREPGVKKVLVVSGFALLVVWLTQEETRAQLFAAFGGWFVVLVLAVPPLLIAAVEALSRALEPDVWHRTRGAEETARRRFYLRAGMTFASGHHVVVTQNLIGLAARQLFISLQRRRWTWTSPPAVADRALRLTQPLLDIAVEDGPPGDGKAIFSFLNDVVILVVARREDLIPAVRERYTMIPHRTDEIGDRDILYLDPMRNRGRWEVVKDFVLPLASWLSLVVAIIAIVVAVSAR